MSFRGLNRSQINALITAGLTGYYTGDQVDTLLTGKAASDHLHTGVYSPVGHTHDYSAVYAALNHAHDDRYFTEGEVNTLLAGYQPLDADLTALASLSSTGFAKRTGANTWAVDSLAASDIPSLDAAKITSGTFDNARVNWAAPGALGSGTPAAVAATTLTGTITDTNTTSVVNNLDLAHAVSSGTPSTAFGLGLRFRGHSATPGNGLRDMGRFRYDWGVNAADASRRSRAVISVVEAGTERDQLIVTGTYVRFNHNAQSPVAYFQFEEGAADGRQRLIHFSDSASSNIIQARGGVRTIMLGPATNSAYSVSAYGMTGNINLTDLATVIPAPTFGSNPINGGTHKSLFISTPETQPGVSGTWTRTDMIDFVAFSCLSNTWGGTRPSLRHTALEHLFRTDSGTGQNNPGTDIFRVQSTGVRVESTLAFHLGDPTVDGTWRIVRSGNNLVFERRESSAWVTKQTIAA